MFVSLTYRKRSAFVGSFSKLTICFKARLNVRVFLPFPMFVLVSLFRLSVCLPFRNDRIKNIFKKYKNTDARLNLIVVVAGNGLPLFLHSYPASHYLQILCSDHSLSCSGHKNIPKAD